MSKRSIRMNSHPNASSRDMLGLPRGKETSRATRTRRVATWRGNHSARQKRPPAWATASTETLFISEVLHDSISSDGGLSIPPIHRRRRGAVPGRNGGHRDGGHGYLERQTEADASHRHAFRLRHLAGAS